MHKLRVGIVVESYLPNNVGGTYSYYDSLLNGINQFDFDESIEIVNVGFFLGAKPDLKFQKPTIFIKGFMSSSFKRKLVQKISKKKTFRLAPNSPLKLLFSIFEKRNNKHIEDQLYTNKIDFLYYLKPEEINLINYPFITNHWDVAHKSTYSFPEFSADHAQKKREFYYNNILSKAFLILCESEAGATELARYYTFNPAKIKVLPIFGNSGLHVKIDKKRSNMALADVDLEENNFFIYPAQFWTFKNHYNLIVAFNSVKKSSRNDRLKLVLCGADHGNLDYIKSIVNELNLNDSVLFPGFVSNEQLVTLYTKAIALVMPTFLGPTNMPLIEAAKLKCPVLCSDFDGHREIMGTHAIYFEPADSKQIENAMRTIMSDEKVRVTLADSAFIHISQSKFNLDKSLNVLNKILLEIKPVRKAWGISHW